MRDRTRPHPLTPADRLLLRTVRDSGPYGPLLAVSCLASAAIQLALPAAFGRALDAVLRPTGAGGAEWAVGVAVVLVALAALTDIVTELATGVGAARATARLRHRLLGRMLAMSPPAAARYPVGDRVARLVGQAAGAGSAANAVILGAVSLLPPAGSLVALTLIDPWLGATFVLGLAAMTLLMRGYVADSGAASAGYQRVQGAIAGRFVEALGGSRTIAAAATAEREIARVLGPLPELATHGRRTWTALATAAGRTTLVAPLTQLAVIAVGGLLTATGRLTPGDLFAAMRYAALGAGLGAVVATLNALVRARAGCARVAEVLAEPPRRYGVRPLPPGPGRLDLCGVTVRVDGRAVLDGVDLCVPAGATVAVVGRSGAGKSMLAEVAGRLRDPDEGRVLLDGVPLAELTRAELGAAVGYGFERPVLVGDTVGEAIAVGRPGTGDGFVASAARVAAVDGYVARLPDGYNTPLARAPMSGGQAQRLGLARALYGGRLLILDDASSSVDSVTEARMRDALVRHMPGRTSLLVTHRVATAARADVVAWLDAGRLRGFAPHAELWADPGYRAVFQPADGSVA